MGGSGDQNLEPGRFTSIMVPLMKAIGLGIAARGGAAGPMLVSGGELIDEGYQNRQQRAVLQQMTQLLQPIARSETTAGIPIERPGALAEPEAAGTMPPQPGAPPARKEWTSMPTQAELMQRIAGTSMPDITRGQLLQEILRLRLPSDVQRPQAVTEELERTRAGETRARQAGALAPALREGATPEERARASVEMGSVLPEPTPGTRTVIQGDRKIKVDTKTGNVVSVEPLRTPEEEAALKQTREQVIPAFEKRLGEAVKSKEISPQEGWVARQLLEQAKASGDTKPFLDYLASISKARARPSSGDYHQETTRTTPAREITNVDEINRLQAAMPEIVQDLGTRYPPFKGPGANVKLPDGTVLPKTVLIERAFRRRHNVDVKVFWNGSDFRIGRAATIPESQVTESTRTRGSRPSELPAEEPE